MKVIPVNNHVVLNLIEPETTTKSGLILNDKKSPDNLAIIEEVPEGLPFKSGDKVVFNTFNQIKLNDTNKVIVKVDNIIAILKD